VLRLRDALTLFEAVFMARDVVFAARSRALPLLADLDALARDLDAVVFAGVLFRDAAVLETAFLETARFFFPAAVLFAAGRPRALVPRPDLEPVVLGGLAIHKSFERCSTCAHARQQSNRNGGQLKALLRQGCAHHRRVSIGP
jgi:hypothetical protein